MRRSAASLADTPTGRPRRRAPRWLRLSLVLFSVTFAGRAVYGLLPPSLTPEQIAEVDADARYAVWKASPEGKGFDHLSRASLALRSDERPIGQCYQILYAYSGKIYSTAEKESAEREARQLLAKHGAVLQAMRASIHQPFALGPWRTMDERAPYLADFRTLARLNAIGAEIKRLNGDSDGAASDLVTGIQYANHLMPGGNVLGRLVGNACAAIAARPLWKVIPDFSPSAYPALIAQLQEASLVPPVGDAIQEEKRLGQRTILQMFGDTRVSKGTPVSPMLTVTSLVWSRRSIFDTHTKYMDTLAAASDKPYQFRISNLPELFDPPNKVLLPAIDGVRFKDAQERAGISLLRQATALYAYQSKHGHFPATLAQTKGQFVSPILSAALPGDPFGQNKPLRYRRTGHTFLLYSIGPDGKDDGGRVTVRTMSEGVPVQARSARYVDRISLGDMVGGINF